MVLWCFQYNQCAGPQKISKLRFSKMWIKKSGPKISIVKNKHNICLKKLNFEFSAVVDQLKLEKNANSFFWIFFISYQNISLVSLLEKIHYFNFLPKDGWAMPIYNFWSFITSDFWGPAHWLYWKHQKTALDSSLT